jgi:hypothetical protein
MRTVLISITRPMLSKLNGPLEIAFSLVVE